MLFKKDRSFFPEETPCSADARAENHPLSGPDRDSLLKAWDGDLEFFRELAAIFLQDAPPMMDTIRDAVQSRDADVLERTAHSLKGMLRGFQFEEGARTAFDLETAGQLKMFDNCLPAYEKLARQLEQACAVLQELANRTISTGK